MEAPACELGLGGGVDELAGAVVLAEVERHIFGADILAVVEYRHAEPPHIIVRAVRNGEEKCGLRAVQRWVGRIHMAFAVEYPRPYAQLQSCDFVERRAAFAERSLLDKQVRPGFARAARRVIFARRVERQAQYRAALGIIDAQKLRLGTSFVAGRVRFDFAGRELMACRPLRDTPFWRLL